MKLNRTLDAAHEYGRTQADRGQTLLLCPGQWDRYQLWAAEAGFAEGRRKWEDLIRRIDTALADLNSQEAE